jgi:hypothetical protein
MFQQGNLGGGGTAAPLWRRPIAKNQGVRNCEASISEFKYQMNSRKSMRWPMEPQKHAEIP